MEVVIDGECCTIVYHSRVDVNRVCVCRLDYWNPNTDHHLRYWASLESRSSLSKRVRHRLRKQRLQLRRNENVDQYMSGSAVRAILSIL